MVLSFFDMTKTVRQQTGAWGEDQAAAWLKEQGYTIVARNYFARVGEIDIVATCEQRLCFIEVKTRKVRDGSAERATSPQKRAKIRLAAEQYCIDQAINPDDVQISFEHVSVYTGGGVDWYALPPL